MKRIPLIRVASIVAIRDFLLRSGANFSEILQSADVPSAVFDDPELLLPYPIVARFLDHAGRLFGGETLGARAGLTTPLETLGIFGRRIATATTLGNALTRAIHVAQAHYSGETFWVTHVGNDVRLCHLFPRHLNDPHQQVEQFSLCITLRFLKSIVAPEWRPLVHLKKGMPRAVADQPILRASAIVFDQPAWAITFPRSLLRRQLPACKAAAPRATELDRWKASAPGGDLATTMTQVIGTALVDGDADIGRVADWVGMSTRTLQRRLEDAGVSYAQMLGRARLAAAVRLLDDATVTLQEISLKIGYSHPAHFTRAFRRWTGCSPRSFRETRMRDAASLTVNETPRWQS
jgi:AraC-like DNA-binding protein